MFQCLHFRNPGTTKLVQFPPSPLLKTPVQCIALHLADHILLHMSGYVMERYTSLLAELAGGYWKVKDVGTDPKWVFTMKYSFANVSWVDWESKYLGGYWGKEQTKSTVEFSNSKLTHWSFPICNSSFVESCNLERRQISSLDWDRSNWICLNSFKSKDKNM